jgi:hypothetical protein
MGFAIEVDGRLKPGSRRRKALEAARRNLNRRFPMPQVRIYDAAARTRHGVVA